MFAILPRTGQLLGVEVKDEKGKLNADQIALPRSG